jgi:hypothetical protein
MAVIIVLDLLSVSSTIYPDKVTASLPALPIVGSNFNDSEDPYVKSAIV